MIPRGLSPAAPSLSLHLFPFSSPLRTTLVWYRLSLVYKYPRVWPCQGQATVAQLSPSFFPFVRSRGQLLSILSLTLLACLVTLDQPGQAWPSPSLKPTPLCVLGSSVSGVVVLHGGSELTCGLYVCVTEGMGR